MKNRETWAATKFTWRKGNLQGDRSGRWVSPGSLLIVDLIGDWYRRVIPVSSSGDFLDLGCGRAPLYCVYKSHASTITCVDWINSPHDIGHIDISADLNEALPLPSSSFDTILVSDVLEHIAKPWVVWSEISRIMRPSGKVIGNVPFLYWVHESPHDYHRYTEHALRRYAKDNGFEGEIEIIGGLCDVLADIFSKVICRVPLIGSSLARLVSFMAYLFGRTTIGRRVRVRTGAFFPLAYAFVMTRASKGDEMNGPEA